MARLLILLSVVVLFSVSAKAQSCCNAGGLASCGSAGLLTGLRSNSVGLRPMLVPFETTATGEDGYRDNFYVLEFAARYQISPRFKISLQQPYRWNFRDQPGTDENLKGLADARLTVSHALLDNVSFGNNSLIYLEFGAGAKLPTGKYDQSIYFRDLPGNLNLGMGNWGWLFQSQLVFFHQKLGLGLNAGYQLNSKSRDDYQFGDQFTAALMLFRELAIGENWKCTPFVGMSGEQFGKNYLPSGNFAEGSGGGGIFATGGLNFRSGKYQAGLSVARPFHQNYASGAIVAKQRYTLEFNYFF